MSTTEPLTLTRRERERLQHEQEILDAAERVFCTKGYHGAAIQDIAQEAEFSVGTLYNFFKNKEDIYDHMLQRKARQVVAFFHEQVGHLDDPLAKIEALFRAKASYFAAHKDFFRFYFLEMRGAVCNADVTTAKRQDVKCAYQDHMLWVADVFREGMRRGQFRETDADLLSGSMESLCNAMLLLYLEDEEKHEINRNIETIMSLFFTGACAKSLGSPA